MRRCCRPQRSRKARCGTSRWHSTVSPRCLQPRALRPHHRAARRRLAIPGGDPAELPTTSRRALEQAGFDIVEQRQPSFRYDRSVLITGEVDRVTGFEKGFPVHQAWRGGSWQPDPLFEAVIPDTVSALERLAPDLIVPAHCTGWKATHAIARHLPGAFIENSVGTTFRLSAAA